MTTLYETIDVEEVRKEIIKFTLNQENFYSFPPAYIISILVKLYNMVPSDDFKDLIKTIQVNLSIQE